MHIGCVGYAVEQGLGRLMKSFVDAGVVTDPIIWPHRGRGRENHPEWYKSGNMVSPESGSVSKLLKRRGKFIDVLMAWETFFDWTALATCREMGIKTVLVPMHEWFPKKAPDMPDLFACPSKLDFFYFADLPYTREVSLQWAESATRSTPPFAIFQGGYTGTKASFTPIPVDPSTWKQRTTALRFLHNAGNVGHRWHKGTLELLQAVPLVKNPDFRLTVRGQDVEELNKVLKQVPEACKDPRLTIELGEVPYEKLWDGFDVYIAPEKQNGLSLPLQEARAAGLVVMTSDRFPHNDWLPREYLIPVSRYERANVGSSYLDFDSAVVEPADIAVKIDEVFGRDIEAYSENIYGWALQNSWQALKPKWLEVLSNLVEGNA